MTNPSNIIAHRIATNAHQIDVDVCGHVITAADIVTDLAEAGFVIVPQEPSDEHLLVVGDPYHGAVDRDVGLKMRREAWRKICSVAGARP